MLSSLMLSRAALSVSMIAFIAVSFLHTDTREQFRRFLQQPLLWGMSLLFIVPLLSGFWSEDKNTWADILQIKAPLLLLPLAFAGDIPLQKKQWEWLGLLFTVLISAGAAWSLFQYLADTAAVHESYLRAKTMLTPLENDHVRFSWLVSVAAGVAGGLAFTCYKKQRAVFYLLLTILAWLVIYLHLLAVRTGLFSLYIQGGGAAAWLLFKKLEWKYGLLLIALLLLLPFTAYKLLPSFQNRVKYLVYDSGFFTKAHYRPGSTDGVRVISLKAGWQLMKEQPLSGTGFGDLQKETGQWYLRNYPEMIEADKIYPSGEWMMYGAAAGWPGFLLFSLSMALPFFAKVRHLLPWLLLNTVAAFSFLFDIGLEVQYGVFCYSFIVLCAYRWLNDEKI